MRDRDAGIDLGIVHTRRRLNGMGAIVLTLTTHGVATVEIAVRFHEAYGWVRRDTVSRSPTGERHPCRVRASGGTHLKSRPPQVVTVMLPGSAAHQRQRRCRSTHTCIRQDGCYGT
jgi:hypothetical protein